MFYDKAGSFESSDEIWEEKYFSSDQIDRSS